MEWMDTLFGNQADWQNAPGYGAIPNAVGAIPGALGQFLQMPQGFDPTAMGSGPTTAMQGMMPTPPRGAQTLGSDAATSGGFPLAEAAAGVLAKSGVPPSAIASEGPSLGDSLSGRGIGGEAARDAAGSTIPPTAAPAQGAAPGAPAAGANPFKGLSQPTTPAPQKVSTPGAPSRGPGIKGGELLALLQMLGGPGGTPPKIPSLGSLIGR